MPKGSKSPKSKSKSPKGKSKSPKGKSKSPKRSKGSKKSLDDDPIFIRQRYSLIDSVYCRKEKNIGLYLKNTHFYETWNTYPGLVPLPEAGDGKSPSKKGSGKKSKDKSKSKSPAKKSKSPSKKSKSPGKKSKSPSKRSSPGRKGSPPKRVQTNEPEKHELEPAEIIGLVAVNLDHIPKYYKVYVEIMAAFKYYDHPKVPPFIDPVVAESVCFRDCVSIYPPNFAGNISSNSFTRKLTVKLRHDFGARFDVYPFKIDLSRTPDSVFFNRPFHYKNSSGVFWKCRAFIGETEFSNPYLGIQAGLDFWKYTIVPIPESFPGKPNAFTRYNSMNDSEPIVIKAVLNKEIYFNNEPISIQITIDNGSNRTSISSVCVFVEQNLKFFKEIPHEEIFRLGEVILNESVKPKTRSWNKMVELTPQYDRKIYNLAIDGRWSYDKRIFLANSSFMMERKIVPDNSPIIPEPSPKKSSKKSPSKKGSSKKKSEKKSAEKKSSGKKSSGKKSKKSKSPKRSPKKEEKKPEPEEAKPVEPRFKEVDEMRESQVCRPVTISYSVHVRVNLEGPEGCEAGNPGVKVPFMLTRETRFFDKMTLPKPPTFTMHELH